MRNLLLEFITKKYELFYLPIDFQAGINKVSSQIANKVLVFGFETELCKSKASKILECGKRLSVLVYLHGII